MRFVWFAGIGVYDVFRVWGICLFFYDIEIEFSFLYMLSKRFMVELYVWFMIVFGFSG